MPVWAFHPEGKSTYEIALSPQTPSAAVDNLGFAYDTIKSVAAKHGFHATMHPKAFSSGPKIGQHIHISIVNPRSGDGDHFLAGILKHMRALSAFWLGGHDSWNVRDKSWGCGYIVWGTSRLVPIRQVTHARWEIRMPDCLANPYIQLAATIAAGLDGIESKMHLTIEVSISRNWVPVDRGGEEGIGRDRKDTQGSGGSIRRFGRRL